MRSKIARITIILICLLGGVSFAGINDGLVGYWPLDEASGTIVSDSENGYDGTIIGAQWVSGVDGSALEFDGVNDYVSLPDNESAWLPSNNFSLSTWIFPERAPGTHEVFFDLDWGASDYPNCRLGISFQRLISGSIKFGFTDTARTLEVLEIDDCMNETNQWYHLVAVRNGSFQGVYINGTLAGSRTCSSFPITYEGEYNNDQVTLGTYSSSVHYPPRNYFKGAMDEVRIYDRALSASEIQTLAGATTPQYTLTMVAYEGGSITSPGEGSFTFDPDTQVELVAEPDPGYVFKQWSGNLYSKRNPITITLRQSMTIRANFEPILHTLSVNTTTGGVIVKPDPSSGSYVEGSKVIIQASPLDPTFTFTGWQGSAVDAGSVANPDSTLTWVKINDDYNLVATFRSVLETLYVDNDADEDPGANDMTLSDPQENGTFMHPFDSIQEAIGVSQDGAKIVVNSGTYLESLDFIGRQITVTSEDVNMPGVYSFPTIDANDTGTVVSFAHGEDANTVLSGFILTGGYDEQAAAIACRQSSPSLDHLLVIGNRCCESMEAEALQGPIAKGILYLVDCNSVMNHLSLNGNYAGLSGSSLRLTDCNAVLINSILWDQLDQDIQINDGTYLSVDYCTLTQLWTGIGNLNLDPKFYVPGYWGASEDIAIAMHPSEPTAVWITGDYHLMSQFGRWNPYLNNWVSDNYPYPINSLCIDAGDPFEPSNGEIEPNGNRVNMGVYGGTQEASLSSY